MALTLRKDARNFPFQVIAKDANGALGAPRPPEVVHAVIGADPVGIVVISLDPNPVPINNPMDSASGTKSVISGVVNATGELGKTTATASLLNADGTVFASVTDMVRVVDIAAGVSEWAGTFFGTDVPLDLPTP